MSLSHILIVDDSKMVRMMLQGLVSAAYPESQVSLADDGDAAFEHLRENSCSLVITDLNMPKVGGEQLYHLTHEAHVAGDIDVMPMFLFCSATTAAIPSLDALCLQDRCSRLAKPFSVDQIEACVQSMLEAASPS